MSSADAVVVGAGQDGLARGSYLAREGLVVVEQQPSRAAAGRPSPVSGRSGSCSTQITPASSCVPGPIDY